MIELPDLTGDLIAYTGREPELVRLRCKTAATELAWLWPQYADNPTAFYQATDLYLFDLTQYQLMLRGLRHAEWLAESVEGWIGERGGCRVLDYGGGIGEWALIAALAGADVTYFDLPGPTLDYARWRFGRYGATVNVTTADPLERDYDVLIAMDVLEHLPDPDPTLARMARRCKFLICNPEQIRYNALYPMHISRYDPSPLFEHVAGYVWRPK